MKLPVKRKWWEFYKSSWSDYIPGGVINSNSVHHDLEIVRHPDRITKEEFLLTVRSLTSPADFENYRSHLDKIDPRHYSKFRIFLLLGHPINLNPNIFNIIDQIHKGYDLIDLEIISMIPQYQLINMMLEEDRSEYERRA